MIESHGGSVASSVTKRVTHVLSTGDTGPKIDKANEASLPIVGFGYIEKSIENKKLESVDDHKFSQDGEKTESKVEKVEEKVKGEETPKRTTRGRGTATTPAEDPSSDSEPETKKQKTSTSSTAPIVEKAQTVKVLVKGRAAVDSYSRMTNGHHVLDDGDTVYDAMLNQTNIGQNNNKFYVIQIIANDAETTFFVWTRWGRVGEKGANACTGYTHKPDAINAFEKKFREKSSNNWRDRKNFRPVSGKYTLIEIDYSADDDKTERSASPVRDTGRSDISSKLDERVQKLVKKIFDLNMMEKVMTEMEFDVKKMPLGKLAKSQITAGYEILKEIANALKSGASGSRLAELSSRFYTLIPHSFGRQVPPVIGNLEAVKIKLDMLAALTDIEIATNIIKESNSNSTENAVDVHYKKLKCEVTPLDKNSKEYKMIEKYVKNTHQGSTPVIDEVYEIVREGEEQRFIPQKPLGNRMLLWHGSRLTNYVGIISQGLRIAPPEAPKTGYRFGKGIYFADIMSLSSKYCFSGGNDFAMLLGDVALGKTADLERDTYMEKPLEGTHSTKALGTIEPDQKENVILDEGVILPSGKIINTGHRSVSCLEHQYVVYDVNQVNLRYMLLLKRK
eukprot:TRINITY_DN8029_c0_g1_i1.p1 TRINITY_DN8029_c0_g1~~TRINITY_DN8029_c0_g1_i1.p1  ORF type:complete len:676 (-),score=238.61 TRINITY_DN8029_c0_g1_i1:70-1926(-)